MAKHERLNEEAASNNNIPFGASSEVMARLNELNDREKQLPKLEKNGSLSQAKKTSGLDGENPSDNNDAAPKYS